MDKEEKESSDKEKREMENLFRKYQPVIERQMEKFKKELNELLKDSEC